MKDLFFKYTSPSKIFLYSILGFILGIFLGPLFLFGYKTWGILSFLIASLGILFWENRLLRVLVFFSLFLIFGIFRYQLFLPKQNSRFIHFYNGQNLEIQGKVVSFPDEKMGKTSFELSFLEIKSQDRGKVVFGKILVEKLLYPEISYGDKVLVKGKLKAPENKEDFAQKDYLASKYIFSYLKFPEIEILERERGNKFWQTIFLLRERVKEIFWSFFPPKEASVLSALVLGIKKEMPSSVYDLFTKTGTAHLIVVSGFHLVILAEILLKILRPYLGIKTLFLVIFICFVFVLLTGANPPAVRAFVFIFLLYLAELFGRKRYFPTTIGLAAFFLLLQNPFLLRFSLSFQFSFLATSGIVLLTPFFEEIFRNFPSIFRFPLSATFSAQIFMFPFLIFGFSSFPFISFLANPLVVLPAQFLLGLGFLLAVMGLIFPNLTFLLTVPAYFLLKFIFFVLDFLAYIPSLNFQIFKFPVIFTLFYYTFLAFLVFKIQKKYALERTNL